MLIHFWTTVATHILGIQRKTRMNLEVLVRIDGVNLES